MPEKDHLRLTREDLYSLVWGQPMTQVVQDFEISDRAMAKLCAKRQDSPLRAQKAQRKPDSEFGTIPTDALDP